jgi:FixJ family two-component response regulator
MSNQKPVVAIVDDDPRVLESLEELLESAGYQTSSFASADAFIGNGLGGIDVLITDIGIPGVDGFQLRKWVLDRKPDMPVFLITGRHEIADRSQAQGITGLFRKPYEGQSLLAAIEAAFGK